MLLLSVCSSPRLDYHWITLTQVQHLALGLAENHKVLIGPPLKSGRSHLDDIPSLKYIKCTTQLIVICKFADGVLNPTACH